MVFAVDVVVLNLSDLFSASFSALGLYSILLALPLVRYAGLRLRKLG